MHAQHSVSSSRRRAPPRCRSRRRRRPGRPPRSVRPSRVNLVGGILQRESGPTGLALAITDNGGKASSTADNFAGPAAIALGPGATVTMTGDRAGLAIGIAGPGGQVVVDGKNGPTCKGPAFAGDFQTLKGCMS